MEQKLDNIHPMDGWTKKELEVLAATEESGARPIAASLVTQLFSLFLEGYSCLEISKQNKGLSEGDLLYCRKKYNWDSQRDEYAVNLTKQVVQKMAKQKLESVEFLTNMLSVIHKEHRDVMLKYLQTGNIDDLPKIGSLRTYKEVIETLAKITGEDSVKKVKFEGNIKQETTLKNDSGNAIQLSPELQTKLLKALASETKENDKGNK
jgi:hypothetical protein